jgi:hypothetical protein
VIAVRENSPSVWLGPKAITLSSGENMTASPLVKKINLFPNVPGPGVWWLTPTLGQKVPLDLNAYDDDNDPLWYTVVQAPRHGTLRFVEVVAGASEVAPLSGQGTTAYSGYRFKVSRLASGQWGFSTAHVVYEPSFERYAKYPVNDLFVLTVDDGGGVPSPPLQVPVRIAWADGPWSRNTLPPLGDGKVVFGADGSRHTSGSSVTVAKWGGAVLLVVLVAVGVYFLKRRGQLRQRFQKLAKGVETAIDGDATELA